MQAAQSHMPLGPRQNFSTIYHDFGRFCLGIVLIALAGGMGWGIRGQYGHETGAMIAGVLVAFTVVLLFIPEASSLHAARVVALTAIGISFGGSETYAQTVGLTHDAPLIGNWAALRWGLLGLFIKGGIWIGFAGVFLGMGLSGKRYRPLEMTLVMAGLLVLMYVGVRTLNEPFDPSNKVLPRLYFSHDWYWNPDADFKPRRERWGGLLLTLGGLMAYVRWVRRDRLATNLALVGFLAGGIGFPMGQCVQAYHAWNPHLYQTGTLGTLEPHMNWWNMMEISFGTIFGGILGVGLWVNRHLIYRGQTNDEVVLAPSVEWPLIAVYVLLLIAAEFVGMEWVPELGPTMIIVAALPLFGILGGRLWPYMIALPLVAAPIAGKTLRELCYKNEDFPRPLGWVAFVAIPVSLLFWRAITLANRGREDERSWAFAREGLLLATWFYFGENFVFFRFPWPLDQWTYRTPSAIIFTMCAISLSAAVLVFGRRDAHFVS
jgi:hypothetical protein